MTSVAPSQGMMDGRASAAPAMRTVNLMPVLAIALLFS
jgi:hypothetical protein